MALKLGAGRRPVDERSRYLANRFEEAIPAPGLSLAALDRRIREGKLPLENAVVVGNREFYRREQIVQIVLAPATV